MDIEQLREDAAVIRDETSPGANTSERIGNMFIDIINNIEEAGNELEDGAVTTEKLADEAVTREKLAFDAVDVERLQGKSSDNTPDDPFTLLLTMTGNWDNAHVQELNEVLDEHHATTPEAKKHGFFRINISDTYLELVSYPEIYLQDVWQQVISGRVKIDDSGRVTLGNDYNIITRRRANGEWSEWKYYSTGMSISGKVNLASASGKTTLQSVYSSLPENGMAFLLVSDSNGNLPSLTGEKAVTVNNEVRPLFTTDSSMGANVGDIVAVVKFKVLVNIPVYRIIPLNDAKQPNGDFPGTTGLVTPWDKKQINLVSTALQLPTQSGSNMNDCLEPGIYPWCTTGRPAGSEGAYTLVVIKTTTKDNNNFDTIEQTAYGREDEIGRIFKRIIFKNLTETQYGEWLEITEKENKFTTNINGNTVAILAAGVKASDINGKPINEVIETLFFPTLLPSLLTSSIPNAKINGVVSTLVEYNSDTYKSKNFSGLSYSPVMLFATKYSYDDGKTIQAGQSNVESQGGFTSDNSTGKNTNSETISIVLNYSPETLFGIPKDNKGNFYENGAYNGGSKSASVTIKAFYPYFTPGGTDGTIMTKGTLQRTSGVNATDVLGGYPSGYPNHFKFTTKAAGAGDAPSKNFFAIKLADSNPAEPLVYFYNSQSGKYESYEATWEKSTITQNLNGANVTYTKYTLQEANALGQNTFLVFYKAALNAQ